jgi:hypothetical protein
MATTMVIRNGWPLSIKANSVLKKRYAGLSEMRDFQWNAHIIGYDSMRVVV